MMTPFNCYQCESMVYLTASEHPYKCLKTDKRLDISETDDLDDFLYLPKWCPLRHKEAVK